MSGLQISFLHAFSNLVDIPSCPQVGLDLRLFKSSMVVDNDNDDDNDNDNDFISTKQQNTSL